MEQVFELHSQTEIEQVFEQLSPVKSTDIHSIYEDQFKDFNSDFYNEMQRILPRSSFKFCVTNTWTSET